MRTATFLFGLLLVAAGSVPAREPVAGADLESSSPTLVQLDRKAGGVEHLGNGDQLHIMVSNHRAAAGEVSITATVLSDRIAASHEAVATAFLPAGSPVVVPIACERLGLPAAQLRFSGLLTLTASVRYRDGLVEQASPALELFFHPEGDGWLLYDDRERSERFHGGVLQAEDRQQLRGGPTFGTAYSRKVAPDTSWRPEGDEATTAPPPAALPAAPQQAGVKLCIEQYSAFSDAGVGEDFWQNPAPTARPSRGAWAAVSRDGSSLWVGFLGDGVGVDDPGSGCTGELAAPPVPTGTYDYYVQIFTLAKVQGNWVNVAYDGGPILDWRFTRSLTGTGTHVVSFDPTNDTGRTFDVAMVGAYCQLRHPAGISGETYRYRLVQDSSDSAVVRSSDTIMIGELRADRKFIIAHETGHLLGDFGTGNNDFKTVDTRCQCYESSSCPSAHGSHTMISKERSRCAMAEGFAHFYAAAVFNSDGTGAYDCMFHYYKEVGGDSTPVVNCEQDEPDGPFDERYMETNCAFPWIGMGTELDWLRTFWDMLSADPKSLDMADFVQWFDLAEYWHDYYAFNNLDAAANLIGGDLDSHWDYFKTLNGVDWPRDGLLTSEGFETASTECWSEAIGD